jgi:DNA-binding NarL/FixJ family response regulator
VDVRGASARLRVLIAEDQYLTREGTRRLLEERARKPGSPLAMLTPPVIDVLRLMAEGKSNYAIADALYVSVGTVEKRIAAAFSALGLGAEPDLNRRVAAVLIYLRESAPG